MGRRLSQEAPGAEETSAALARLSETLKPSLFRYFQRRVKDSGKIEDLVQED